jgi:hypothetical protein
MAQPKSIFPELKNNAEPMNGVRRLRTAEKNGHDPLVNLRNWGASGHDRRIGRRKPVAAAVMAYLPMARARGAASFLARQATRQFVLTSSPPIKPKDRLLAELAPAHGATGTCIEKENEKRRLWQTSEENDHACANPPDMHFNIRHVWPKGQKHRSCRFQPT